jgi:hypothetical protein
VGAKYRRLFEMELRVTEKAEKAVMAFGRFKIPGH